MSTGTMDPIYRLHTQCLLTSGPARSVIIDLDRRKYETIPNGMFNVLDLLQKAYPIRWSKIMEQYEAGDQQILEQYKEWLIERDYIHEVLEGTVHNWPPLPMVHEKPNELEDGIIDLSKDGGYPLLPVIRQFEKAGCKSLHIRDFDGFRLPELCYTLAAMSRSIICNMHLLICASRDAIAIAAELSAHTHVTSVTYHGCDREQLDAVIQLGLARVHAVKQYIQDEGCCGRITPDTFTVNHQFLAASGRKNTCLDRKLSIDRFGNVKNCPSMKQAWAQAEDFDILSVLRSNEFRSVWTMSKDQIGICQVCEFRDICSDCRAYVTDPSDPHSKPAKCNYDPYTATWRA